jgi:hypothetical protein
LACCAWSQPFLQDRQLRQGAVTEAVVSITNKSNEAIPSRALVDGLVQLRVVRMGFAISIHHYGIVAGIPDADRYILRNNSQS